MPRQPKTEVVTNQVTPRLCRPIFDCCLLAISLASYVLVLAPAAADEVARPSVFRSSANLGARWELFVDDWLVAGRKDATLKLHPPERREVVLVTDAAWEG